MSHSYFGKEVLTPANTSSWSVNQNIYTFNFVNQKSIARLGCLKLSNVHMQDLPVI